MEITMIKKILHRIILGTLCFGCCLACASCSQESITPPVSATGNGQVKILYKIAGTSLSRATEEPGWGDEDNDGTDEWHENIINRIDLFVFNSNNKTLFKHIASSGNLNVDAKSVQTLTQNELTYNDVTTGNYIYYMVANCEFDDNIVEGVFTLEDLKKKITPKLTFNDKQTSFAMDGMIENTPLPTNNTITLTFELKRAAVKIRLSVNNNQESIIKNCKFQLFKYVDSGTSVLNEAESYGEIDRRKSMDALEAYNKMTNYENEKVIFYSYPNDWFDESLLNENGTFSDEDIYAIDDLIDEEKQTYILLEAPYGDDSYYYKVPVNFAISKDNDKVSFSKEDIEDLRNNYYRMLRNHIYDITVTIDREGGITEDEAVKPVLQYEVMGYDETEIDVPAFT